MPKVTIGMPVYNGENFIRDAFNSILAQTYSDWELVISDNASTDRTEQICREYAQRDHRIHYYRSAKNLGASWNYVRVFQLASGEYFKWAAHDDMIAPDFLRKCVDVLDRDPGVVVVYARTQFIDETGNFVGTYDPDTSGFDSPKPRDRFRVRTSRIRPPFPFVKRMLEDAHAVFGLIRTDALKSVPPLGNYGASDQILLAQLALRGRFHRIPEYLFFNRDHQQRSIRAYSGRRRQTLWLDPGMRRKVYFAEWRMLREFVRSVQVAPLERVERFLCYWEISKYFMWNSPRLVLDLLRAGHQFLTGMITGGRCGPIRSQDGIPH